MSTLFKKGALSTGDALPIGWIETTLGTVALSPRPKIAPDPKSRLPFIGMEHIEPNSMKLSGKGAFCTMKSAAGHFLPGDVLYGRMRPYLNKVHRASFEGACSAEFIVIPASPSLDGDFLRYLLHSKRFVAFASNQSSGDRPRVDFKDISEFCFTLPPLFEQARIVAKLDELFSRIEKGEENLKRVQALVKRYRQAVLKAAVTGELTRDWREKNAGKGESGADLLQRILAARRTAWEKAELAKMKAKGNRPTDHRWKQKYEEPNKPEVENLPDLPEGWAWATIDQLICYGPANGYSPKAGPNARGTLSLKLTATTLGELRLDKSATKQVQEDIDPASPYWLEPGDILVQRANSLEHLGATAIYEGPTGTYIYPDLMMRIRVADPVLRIWIWRYLNGDSVRHQFRRRATGTAGSMPKINAQILRSVPIPVPPAPELKTLTERLEQLWAITRRTEADLVSQLRCATQLRQQILQKAFSGKLVPQDPDDEPALVLMERIAAGRNSGGPTKSVRGRLSKSAMPAQEALP